MVKTPLKTRAAGGLAPRRSRGSGLPATEPAPTASAPKRGTPRLIRPPSRGVIGVPPSYLKRIAEASTHASPPARWWKVQLPRLLRRWAAFGAHLGHKTLAGQRVPVVCLVVHTTAKRVIAAGESVEQVPALIRWRAGGQYCRLPTDVVQQHNGLSYQSAPVFGPGDRVRLGNEVATIGAAVDHPQFGRCLMTAGHVIPAGTSLGVSVEAWADSTYLPTVLRQYSQEGATDFALLKPLQAAVLGNLVKDYWRIGPVYVPTASDVGAGVFAVRQDGLMYPTTVRGVAYHFTAPNGTYYANLILVDQATTAGDSGGALLDQQGRTWGFLIGVTQGYSVFSSAASLLPSAGVQLV